MTRFLLASITAAFLFGATGAGLAQASLKALDFATAHPVDNSRLNARPALGDSVPQAVDLKTIEGNKALAYFYYDGQPVLVDLKTRAVVKVGQ